MTIYLALGLLCALFVISTFFYIDDLSTSYKKMILTMVWIIMCTASSAILIEKHNKSIQMPKPVDNDKVQLKPEAELLQIMRNKNWNGNDENRQEIAKEFGGKIVVVKNPQDHHNYFFTEEGPSFDYSMIDSFK